MPIHGLGHVNLRAPRDLVEALREFYCAVVGLEVGPRPPLRSFGYWLYAGERAVLHLSEERPGEPRSPLTRNTYDHVAFRCSGWAEYEQRLQVHGIDYRRVGDPQAGGLQVFLVDPAGNGVELGFDGRDA